MPLTGVLLDPRDQITSKCVILLLQQKLHLLFILSRFSASPQLSTIYVVLSLHTDQFCINMTRFLIYELHKVVIIHIIA